MARTTANLKPARLTPQRPVRPAAPRRSFTILDRIVRYVREVRTELARVDWPSRKELIASTVIVVVVLVVLALYLGAWDYVFTVAVRRTLVRH